MSRPHPEISMADSASQLARPLMSWRGAWSPAWALMTFGCRPIHSATVSRLLLRVVGGGGPTRGADGHLPQIHEASTDWGGRKAVSGVGKVSYDLHTHTPTQSPATGESLEAKQYGQSSLPAPRGKHLQVLIRLSRLCLGSHAAQQSGNNRRGGDGRAYF